MGVVRRGWHVTDRHSPVIQPFVPGHELSGVVVETGPSVTRFKPGDRSGEFASPAVRLAHHLPSLPHAYSLARVAVPFILSCGGCRECHRGKPTVCEHQEQPGFTLFGSFAECVALPRADRNLAHLPDEVSFEAAAALGW